MEKEWAALDSQMYCSSFLNQVKVANQIKLTIVVFGNHGDFGGSQETRVETYSELTDQVKVPPFNGFDEISGP